jgi:hypothetical protein
VAGRTAEPDDATSEESIRFNVTRDTVRGGTRSAADAPGVLCYLWTRVHGEEAAMNVRRTRTVRLVLSGREVDIRMECHDYRDTLQYLTECIARREATVVTDSSGRPCVVNWATVALAYVLDESPVA